MNPIKTITTTYRQAERFRLANETSGFILQDGELMQILSLKADGPTVIVELVPARFWVPRDEAWRQRAA